MTTEQRAAARERCEKATPGPWEDFSGSLCNWHDHTFEMEFIDNTGGVNPKEREDMSFMAHARTDLPAALDAMDAADRRIAALEFHNAELDFGAGGVLSRLADRDKRITELEQSLDQVAEQRDEKERLLMEAENRIGELESALTLAHNAIPCNPDITDRIDAAIKVKS